MSRKVVVVGAGVIGMTVAIRLLEENFKVTVLTKDEALNTNSDAAVATWYVPDDTKPILQKLCLDSFSALDALSEIHDSGVQKITIIHYYKNEEEFKQSAWAKEEVMQLTNISFDLPKYYVKRNDFPFAFSTCVPLIDPNIYRSKLLQKFYFLGGTLEIKTIKSFNELIDSYDVVINSAGWEAKYLTDDEKIYPVRGQVEIMKLNENIKNKNSFNVKDENSYVIYRPTSHDCVIGTTYQINDSDKEIREADKSEMIKKTSVFFSKKDIPKTKSQVGIRCGREDVRLEAEIIEHRSGTKRLIVHCYGHGGSGYSAAFGTADEVCKIILAV